MKGFLVAAIAVASLARGLSAQVGHPPQNSPYRDLALTMETTVYGGYYRAKADPARVAPESGPLVGVLYQWRMSGPANLTVDLARVDSERRVLDPERLGSCLRRALPPSVPARVRDVLTRPSSECKSLGAHRWPLYMADAGLSLSTTGARSWLNIVPDVRLGVGLVSDFHTKPDVGEFAFGTRFAFNWGAGIRFVPGDRFQLRVDLLNRLYSVRYPATYYAAADDGTRILGVTQSRSAWLNNPALTIGMSYLFAR
jgi:hypothetical protein